MSVKVDFDALRPILDGSIAALEAAAPSFHFAIVAFERLPLELPGAVSLGCTLATSPAPPAVIMAALRTMYDVVEAQAAQPAAQPAAVKG